MKKKGARFVCPWCKFAAPYRQTLEETLKDDDAHQCTAEYRCPITDCYFTVSGPRRDVEREVGHHNLVIHATVHRSSGGKANG